MDKAQIAETSARMVEAVKASIAAATAPLMERIAELESQVQRLPAPQKGERGEPGRDGKDADSKHLEAFIHSEIDGAVKLAVAALPRAADGAPGRDGRDAPPAAAGKDGADGKDGFSLEDFSMELAEDGRTLTLKFQRGDAKIERSIKLATLIYREVWREGEYERGDVVSWGGSAWHCQQQTNDKPGQSPAWKLMVKEGRAGKDATAGAPAAHKPVRVA